MAWIHLAMKNIQKDKKKKRGKSKKNIEILLEYLKEVPTIIISKNSDPK